MKRPAIIDGILVAVVLSIVAAGFFPVAVWLFSTKMAIAVVSALIALSYTAYLLRLRSKRAGVFFMWTCAAVWAGAGVFFLALPAYLLSLAVMIWAVRWVSVGGGLIRGLIDAGLTGASIGFAGYAVAISGSITAGLWCFLLIQSLWSLIPNCGLGKKESCNTHNEAGRFDRAHLAAEEALRELVLRAG